MVSNASEDLPEPERPVITTSWSRGRSTSIFLRLCTRAPRTAIQSWAMLTARNFERNPNSHFSTRCVGIDEIREREAALTSLRQGYGGPPERFARRRKGLRYVEV